MTALPGTRGQSVRDVLLSVSGTTTSGIPKSLVLPEQRSRSHFIFQNLSTATMYLEIGCGEATATISGGVVTSIAVVNGGFNYTIAPKVLLMGGGADGGNTTFVGCTSPGYSAPGDSIGIGAPPIGYPAQAHAVISGGAVTSIVVDNGGSGFAKAPWVLLVNDPNDPNGVADPSVGSGSGIKLASGASYYVNGTICTTSPISVYCATSGSAWCCKFAV